MKTLKQIMGNLGGYEPKPEGEQDFVKKHVVDKTADANGNGDDVFNAANVKTADRPGERHGYTDQDDDKVSGDKPTPEPKVSGDQEWTKVLRKYKRLDGGVAAEQVEVEEKELIGEGVEARARFDHYHAATADLLKGIGEALKKHKAGVDKKNTHWGHVGDIKHYHRQLQDLHDSLAAQGEYQQQVAVKEETEQLDEVSHETKKSYAGKAFSDWSKNYLAAKKETDPAKKAALKAKMSKRGEGLKKVVGEEKQPVKGKGVPPSGAYDSVPLGITVANEEIDVSMLELFVSLDQEEQQMFIEMLESDSALLNDIAQEAK